jgi:hypothetical protein
MKRLQKSDGSVLITAAIVAGVLALLTGAYLYSISNLSMIDNHMQQWQQSLHLAEAAVEVGLNELNYHYATGVSAFQSGSGWTDLGGGTNFSKTANNFVDANGKVIGSYTVTVSGVNGSNPWILGVGTCANLHGPSVSRAVDVVTKRPFSYGLFAKQTITLSGGGIADSFNSSDPTKSTAGQFDIAKRQANANMATASTGSPAVKLGTLYGTIATGPGGQVTFGSSMGPTTDPAQRVNSQAAGEAKGWITHNWTSVPPDNTVPSDLVTAPNLGTIINTSTLTSGSYRADAINLGGGTLSVSATGPVRLYVTGDVTLTSGNFITLLPGADLEIYIGGKVKISAGAAVNNPGIAIKNRWYGLPSSSDWTVSGSGEWVGIMNAPNASITYSGSADASGTFIGNDITISGGGAFHYDEALGGGSSGSSYVVKSWKEYRNVAGNWIP